MQCNAVSGSELMEASGAIGENGGACGDIEDHFVVEFISSVSHILIILTLDVKTSDRFGNEGEGRPNSSCLSPRTFV